MKQIAEVNIDDETMTVHLSQYYQGKAMAVSLKDEFGSPYGAISVNLDKQQMARLEEGEFWYKTHDGHPDIIEDLRRQKIVTLVEGKQERSGFATYKCAKLMVTGE